MRVGNPGWEADCKPGGKAAGMDCSPGSEADKLEGRFGSSLGWEAQYCSSGSKPERVDSKPDKVEGKVGSLGWEAQYHGSKAEGRIGSLGWEVD